MQAGNGAVQVIGDGSQVRDLVFVEDVAKAALTVATCAPMRGEAWNVGSGRGMTIRELVDAIGGALGLKAKPTFTGSVRPGDLEAMVADCTRLAQLGWKPVVPLEKGLKATLAWLRQTRQSAFV
jgi:nucleoside-diphosphate-sugar epimerase